MYASDKYRLKSPEEYASETNTSVPIIRKYLKYTNIDDIVMKCPLANKIRLSEEQKNDELKQRTSFLDLLKVCILFIFIFY